jgi:hypothetical protein
MFKNLILAVLALGASAYVPAMPGTQLAASKVAARPQYTAPMPAAMRSSEVSMSAVTERDADGNPVTHFEMFDVFWIGIILVPWLTLLVANPF